MRRVLNRKMGTPIKDYFVAVRRLGEKVSLAHPDPAETVMLVGSGRSGTTWLLNLIGAAQGVRTIFEPMNPVRIDKGIRDLVNWDGGVLFPKSIYLRPQGEHDAWAEYLAAMLGGKLRNHWTDQDAAPFFPDRYVIKLIRANLMLEYIYAKFQPKIIFLTRHPAATILSKMRLNFRADVDVFLQQEELIADHLLEWVKLIEKERDPLGAHAVTWAVENGVALAQLAQVPHYNVAFEDLCLCPEKIVPELFEWLALPLPINWQEALLVPSRMTKSDIDNSDRIRLVSRWKNELNPSEVDRILTWAHRLGVKKYTDDVLPIS